MCVYASYTTDSAFTFSITMSVIEYDLCAFQDEPLEKKFSVNFDIHDLGELGYEVSHNIIQATFQIAPPINKTYL